MSGLTTPREELITYFSLRSPHWTEDWKAITAVHSHGHSIEHIQQALRGLIESGSLEERESSVKFHGKRVMFVRERKSH